MGIVLFYLGILGAYIAMDQLAGKQGRHRSLTRICPPPAITPTDIVVHGKDLGISSETLVAILNKRFPYYSRLSAHWQTVFVARLQAFLQTKTFIIKDEEGVREMPVLTAAAAVQLTFGLRDYKLPFYKYIRVYPEEFVSEHSLRVLAGNVHANVITVAWKHLLTGLEDCTDGCNVGLHEMSHALQIQKLDVEKGYANKFAKRFAALMKTCKAAFAAEAVGSINLYSAYANTNMDEFWAESVELFFEKPSELMRLYPDLFREMQKLLRQNPLNEQNPVLEASLFAWFSGHPRQT